LYEDVNEIITDIPTPHHINPCNQILSIMKYGVNRVALVGNVGEVPRLSERDGEAFVANFPLATNEFCRNKEGEEAPKTEWQRMVVCIIGKRRSINQFSAKSTENTGL
jgi:hypothetical protein